MELTFCMVLLFEIDCSVASITLVSTLNSFFNKIKIKNFKILILIFKQCLIIEAYILYGVIF